MTLSNKQLAEIVQIAATGALELSLPEIGEQFGVSGERVRQVLEAHAIKKHRKLGALFQCKSCSNQFRGTQKYGGEKARYCHACRKKRAAG